MLPDFSASGDSWERVLDALRNRVSEQKFNTWFRPLRAVVFGPDRIVLEVPNPFFIDWFEEHNLPLLRSAIAEVLPEVPPIQFVVAESFSDRPAPLRHPTCASRSTTRPAPAPRRRRLT